MLYRFLISKKGFTMMEMLIVVAVVGILVAVAVPIFDGSLKVQKRNDCRNQKLVIETAVKQAMYGMLDNGRRQEEIGIAYWPDGDQILKKQYNPNDTSLKLNIDAKYDYKYFTKLDDKLTLGKIRGGYRDINQYPDYKDGCEIQNRFLKKQKLENVEFYRFLDNQEIPVCPFADYENSDTKDDYYYCIFYDGTVCCTCPECNKAD